MSVVNRWARHVGGQRVKLPDISVTILLFTYGRNYTDYVTIHFIFFFPQFSIARLRFVPIIPSFHISYSSHLMYLASTSPLVTIGYEPSSLTVLYIELPNQT